MALTRNEFYSRVGLRREIDPSVTSAYSFTELMQQALSDKGSDHEHPWHISFHGSEFPGDNKFACGRKSIYRLMDIPRGAPNRWLRQLADQGKDHEIQLCKRWYNAGMLVSAPPVPGGLQTQFEDKEHWLTSTVDAIILHPRSITPVVAEEKQKYAREIERMKRLIRGPDEQHIRQVKCQIGMAHEAGEQKRLRCYNTGRLAIELRFMDGGIEQFDGPTCPQHGHDDCLEWVTLDPVTYGYIYYVSRDEPSDTWEYYYEYDPRFMEAGRKQLDKWKQEFLNGMLPQTDFSEKRFSHPFGWLWTKPEYPCRYCDYGDICRLDHRAAVEHGAPIKLSESNAIEEAEESRSEYSYEQVRDAVLARWGLRPQKST